jgi:hypothetical protein
MLGMGLVLAAVGATPGAFAGEPPRTGGESPSPAAGALYDQAVRSFARKDGAYRRALVGSLRSPNRLERKLALERLEKLPELVDASVVDALVPILEETTPLGPVRIWEQNVGGSNPLAPTELSSGMAAVFREGPAAGGRHSRELAAGVQQTRARAA